MKWEKLLSGKAPWFHAIKLSPADATDLVHHAEKAYADGAVHRILRGRKMFTKQALFDEVAAALQFPVYFGENWDALNECLIDLNWLPRGAVVLLITEADELPRHLDKEFIPFLMVLKTAVVERNSRIPGDDASLHVIFQLSATGSAQFAAVCKAKGMDLDLLKL